MPKQITVSSLDEIAVEVADEEAAAALLPPEDVAEEFPPPGEVEEADETQLPVVADASNENQDDAVDGLATQVAVNTTNDPLNGESMAVAVNNNSEANNDTEAPNNIAAPPNTAVETNASSPPAKKKTHCSQPNCPNLAIKKGLCYRHGAKSLLPPKPQCKVPNCTNQVQRGGVCCKHGAKVKECKIDDCTKNAVRGGLCCKHGRMEGVVVEKICKVENCNNRVLKRKKSATVEEGDSNSSNVGQEKEEEAEEDFCKRHAVKKVDEDGHVICSERWCRNKVISDGGGTTTKEGSGDGEPSPSTTCCEKGDEAVPLCMKHCKNTHHLDCDSDCKSSVHHDHGHHHDHDDVGEEKKTAKKKKQVGGNDHDHHHHDHHHASNRKLAPCAKCIGCKALPCKKCTNCTSTPKKRCKERTCSNPIWMDRKEYDDMIKQRKMTKGDDVEDVEKKDTEEEVVDELEEIGHHDHDHNHEDGKGATKEAAVAPKKPLNGYMRYVAEIREAVTAEFSELTPKELVSILVVCSDIYTILKYYCAHESLFLLL